MPEEAIVILLLGATKSGKTNFARRAAGYSYSGKCESMSHIKLPTLLGYLPVCFGRWRRAAAPYYHRADFPKGTTECTEYSVKAHGKEFRLIDTPGLDENPRLNRGILQKIVVKLDEIRPQEVGGVIYFHTISTRLTGPARSNIDIFEKVCGEPFLRNALFVTTMWDVVSAPGRGKFLGMAEELERKQLKNLKASGTSFYRFSNSEEKAKEVLRLYIAILHKSKARLQLGEEVARWGTSPSDVQKTEAGKLIERQLKRGSSACIII